MHKQKLFSPIKVGALNLPHRIVMAPLTRCRADADLAPHAINATYYAQRASAALIISEATQVSPQGIGYMGTPGIHTPKQVAGWKLVTEAVHKAGGRIFAQLWHVGRISHPSLQLNRELPVSASAIAPSGKSYTPDGPQPFVTPRALRLDEIPGIIEQYRHAAKCAKEAGFDGVEIHSANGYLLDQFIRDGSNKRTDAYGGSKENRTRLVMEVTQAVVDVWGADRVGIRLSPNGMFNDMHDSNPSDTFGYLVTRLNALGLAYLHLREPMEEDIQAGHPVVPLSYFRSLWSGVLMANSLYDKDRAEEQISEGLVDVVAFGRLFIANPDLPKRFQKDAPLNKPDESTFYAGGEKGYIDYPTLGA